VYLNVEILAGCFQIEVLSLITLLMVIIFRNDGNFGAYIDC